MHHPRLRTFAEMKRRAAYPSVTLEVNGRVRGASQAVLGRCGERVQAFGLSLVTNLEGRAALSPSKGAGPPIAGQNDSSRVLSAIRCLAISGGRAAETPSISASASTPLLGR